MSEKRGFWYLLSGLVFGLGVGLGVAWGLMPTQFIDTTPASLSAEAKDDYRFMIASAFNADPDLLRARIRLETLQDPDPIKALGEQAQRMLANSLPRAEIQWLADLTTALQNQPTPVPSSSPDPNSTLPASATIPARATLSATRTPSPSPTATTSASPTPTVSATATIVETSTPLPKPLATIPARPTQTITPTPETAFALTKQSSFCEPAQPGLIRINLTNSSGKPAPGIELVITWFSGEEHFFTGLKPELGHGYADFRMTENIEYALSLSGGNTRITGLSAQKCSNPQTGKYPGGIQLEFKQP